MAKRTASGGGGTATADKLLLALAALGMLITAYLTVTSWWDSGPAFCTAGSSCDLIRQSRWSTVLGLPLALWGFLLYLTIAYLAWRPASRLRRWKRLWNLALIGVAISLYLTAVGWLALDALCPWCLASLAVIVGIFAAVALRRPPSAPEMPWWNWWLNSGVLVLVTWGATHAYYNFEDLFQPPEDPRLEALAQHLERTDAEFYGAAWCVNCQEQKALFGDAAELLPYTECSPGGRNSPMAMACVAENIQSYPTWIIRDQRHIGVMEPEELARLSGFNWEAGSNTRETGTR